MATLLLILICVAIIKQHLNRIKLYKQKTWPILFWKQSLVKLANAFLWKTDL